MRLKGPSIGFNCTERTIVILMEGRPHAHQASLDDRSDSWLDFISYIFAIQHRLIVVSRRRHTLVSLPSLFRHFVYQVLVHSCLLCSIFLHPISES
jgi:hypothetical protein